MIKKLNPKHLKKLLNNECNVKIFQEGLSEEGGPLEAFYLENVKCRFVEKTKVIISAEGKKIELAGKIIAFGDIFILPSRQYTVKEINNIPVCKLNEIHNDLTTEMKSVDKVSGGEVYISNSKYHIYKASKPRNPDGSVFCTVLELI